MPQHVASVSRCKEDQRKGSWHFRPVHQTTSYDKVYFRFPPCRHRTPSQRACRHDSCCSKQHQATLVQCQFPGSDKLSRSHSPAAQGPGIEHYAVWSSSCVTFLKVTAENNGLTLFSHMHGSLAPTHMFLPGDAGSMWKCTMVLRDTMTWQTTQSSMGLSRVWTPQSLSTAGSLSHIKKPPSGHRVSMQMACSVTALRRG
ncbi:hypothetical protein DE146DRAFT_155322 [Phaeosphaeria sp. MPI-PUGE-AT-0046c]|nr:hypothetical protein DE146DRAFT_155322 [Phaeosphaeria sp. MPI-PUGE-AT-0046c]